MLLPLREPRSFGEREGVEGERRERKEGEKGGGAGSVHVLIS